MACACQLGHNTPVSSAVSQSHVFSVFVLFSYTNEASVPKERTGGRGAGERKRRGVGGGRGNQGLLLLTELHLDGLYGALFVT